MRCRGRPPDRIERLGHVVYAIWSKYTIFLRSGGSRRVSVCQHARHRQVWDPCEDMSEPSSALPHWGHWRNGALMNMHGSIRTLVAIGTQLNHGRVPERRVRPEPETGGQPRKWHRELAPPHEAQSALPAGIPEESRRATRLGTSNQVGLGRLELPTSRLSGVRVHCHDSGDFSDFKAIRHDLPGVGTGQSMAFSA